MLKLVQESPAARPAEFCDTCETKKQLEHVKMLLNAALIAANKTTSTHRGKK